MAIAGKGGSVSLDANKVAEIENWSLDLEADDLETTSFDSDGKKTYIRGLTGWSGSFEGNFAKDDTNGQNAIFNAWVNGTALSFTFKVDDTVSYSGTAFVTPSIEVPVGDTVTFSCDFQGTGALTRTA